MTKRGDIELMLATRDYNITETFTPSEFKHLMSQLSFVLDYAEDNWAYES